MPARPFGHLAFATFALAGAPALKVTMDILQLIEQRQSSRVPFDPDRKIPEDHLQQILEAARWAPTAHNMQNFQIVVVDDQRLLKELSHIPAEHSRAFVAETYEQLSFSEEELKRKRVGLLATMFPPSWRNPAGEVPPPKDPVGVDHAAHHDSDRSVQPVSDALGGHTMRDVVEAHGPERWVEPALDAVHAHTLLGGPAYLTMTAALLVVLHDPRRRAPGSEGDALGMISLGCVMENMWLVAESLRIGFQVQSILGADRVAEELKRILGVPKSLDVGLAVRLGYPTAPRAYLRVRRDREEFAHRNRFGQR